MVLSRPLSRFFAKKPLNITRKLHSLQEEIIHINSQKINYLRVGHGERKLVCFPGAMGTIWTDFKTQIEGFDKNTFTVVVWDPVGHGNSRPPERRFTSNFYREDADTLYQLMQKLSIGSFSLLGWSDGGISSMIFAAKYPKLVDNLVVWGASSFIMPQDAEEYEKIRDVKKWSERKRNPLIQIYGEENLQEVHNNYCDAVKEIASNGGDICSSILKNIDCPTLILHGEKDMLVDPTHPKYLLKNINNSKLYSFPNGKHNIHQRYSEEFNDVVTKFILGEMR